MHNKEISARFSEDARNDFLSILHYISISLSNPDAAETFKAALYKSINLLLTFPHAHPVAFKIKYEYRKMTVSNYSIFYVIKGNEIMIARALHGRQNFKRLFKKSQFLN